MAVFTMAPLPIDSFESVACHNITGTEYSLAPFLFSFSAISLSRSLILAISLGLSVDSLFPDSFLILSIANMIISLADS